MCFVQAFHKGNKLLVDGFLFQKHIFKLSYGDEDVEVPFDIVQLENFQQYFFLIMFFGLMLHDVL